MGVGRRENVYLYIFNVLSSSITFVFMLCFKSWRYIKLSVLFWKIIELKISQMKSSQHHILQKPIIWLSKCFSWIFIENSFFIFISLIFLGWKFTNNFQYWYKRLQEEFILKLRCNIEAMHFWNEIFISLHIHMKKCFNFISKKETIHIKFSLYWAMILYGMETRKTRNERK